MRTELLVSISNSIESLQGFQGLVGIEASRAKLQFQIGFLRAIESNEDLIGMLCSEEDNCASAFCSSLEEMESLIGEQSRVRLFGRDLAPEKMGSYAARIVIAQTMFRKCEHDLLGIQAKEVKAQVKEEIQAQAKAEEAQDTPDNVSSIAALSAKPERPVRNIDDTTGKTLPTPFRSGAQEKQSQKVSSLPSASMNKAEPAPAQSKSVQAGMTGEDCVNLLESTEREMSSMQDSKKDLAVGGAAKPGGNADVLAKLRSLGRDFSATIEADGAQFVRNSPMG